MKIFLFLGAYFFLLPWSFSQNIQKDSINYWQVKNTMDLYNHYTDGQAPIYNGMEYIYYTFKEQGDPFFEKAGFSNGWIGYKGRIYSPLSFFFDIQRNQLVILSADSISSIVMQNEHVDSFYLHNHTFVSLQENQRENLYNTAFYDRLYNGNVQLLARRYKIMDEVIRDGQVTRIFYQKNRYYIHKEGLYYLVSNKKEVLNLFADKKPALKKQMRKSNVKFRRKNFQDFALQVTALYDQLTH